VKICNLYGDGFYYLPGTDICVKIGGYVRAEYGYLGGASMTNENFQGGNLNAITTAISNTGPNGYNDRWDGGDWVMRSRAYMSMDTRQQTEFGILRSYINIGINFDSPAAGSFNVFSGNRAFLQFAGFTIGLAQSFFDFYSVPISSYWGIVTSDTGDGGWKVAAFTANFGNGITSTLSLEEPRRIGIVNTNAAANPFTLFGAAVGQNGITGAAGADSAKERFPDMVWNARIDQVWGSAQVMFAAHDASAAYYFSTAANGAFVCPTSSTAAVPGAGVAGSIIGAEVCGHPADRLGYAAGAGFRLNVPNTNGSYFQFQYTHTVGATKYMFQTQTGYWGQVQGGTMGFGFLTDGIVNNFLGTVRLTRVDGINAAFDYHWTPKFWTSLYGTWAKVRYDGDAGASICFNQAAAAATGGGLIFVPGLSNCANDWSIFQIGSRWQYNLTPAFYIGVDVLYQKLYTADAGGTIFFTNSTAPFASVASVAIPNNFYQVTNQDNWGFRARVHRDILP
jgi:hypothetical protein